MNAIDSLYEAQKIVFSPFVFQTVYSMYELGLFEIINEQKEGLTIDEIAEKSKVSKYGVTVLIEMAEAAEIVEKLDCDKYQLTKVWYFIFLDEMTRVNMMFTQDVCYEGLYHLKDAISTTSPSGLKVFGDWKTVYEGLASLPASVKKAWPHFNL